MQIKNRYTGEVILEIDGDLRWSDLSGSNLRWSDLSGSDLSWSDLRWSDLRWSDLSGSDLSGSDLSWSNLRWSDLSGSDLSGSDLRGSDLRWSDLRGSDLSWSDLRWSDLSGSDLSGSNLSDCAGNRKEIKSLFISDAYPITYTAEYLQIGCERHKISDWWEFSDEEIDGMDDHALELWKQHKDFIRQIIETFPAKPTGKEE